MNGIHSPMRIAAAAGLLSGSVAGLGGGVAGIAHAENWCPREAMLGNGICYGPNQWCPGDSLFHLTQNHVANPINWDMNVCHTYYYVQWGQGNAAPNIWDGANPPPPETLPESPPAPQLPPGMCWSMWIPAPCPAG